MRYLKFLCYSFFILLSCQSQKLLIKPGYDFSQIHTIVIEETKDCLSARGSGDIVTRALAHHLMKLGLDIVERGNVSAVLKESAISQTGISSEENKNVSIPSCDAIMLCSISEFKDQRTVFIPIEIEDKGRTISITETAYEDSDSSDDKSKGKVVTEKTRHFKGSVKRTKEIRYIDAVVGLTLQLIDAENGTIIWSSNFSYSSLHKTDALNRCISGALKPLKKILKK